MEILFLTCPDSLWFAFPPPSLMLIYIFLPCNEMPRTFHPISLKQIFLKVPFFLIFNVFNPLVRKTPHFLSLLKWVFIDFWHFNPLKCDWGALESQYISAQYSTSMKYDHVSYNYLGRKHEREICWAAMLCKHTFEVINS